MKTSLDKNYSTRILLLKRMQNTAIGVIKKNVKYFMLFTFDHCANFTLKILVSGLFLLVKN